MNKKTRLAGIVAGAALTLSGFALAQTANPPTSTPGAGCTATGNAMRGGNLGGNPSSTACAPGSTNTTAAAPAAAADTGTASSASSSHSATADNGSSGTMANSTSVADSGSSSRAPRRAARADRN